MLFEIGLDFKPWIPAAESEQITTLIGLTFSIYWRLIIIAVISAVYTDRLFCKQFHSTAI